MEEDRVKKKDTSKQRKREKVMLRRLEQETDSKTQIERVAE